MIRPPAINLASRPFRNNTAYYAVYSACLALLLAATIYNGWRFFAGGSELARLREDVSFASERYMKLHDEVEEMKKQINTLDLAVINTKSSFAEGLILSRFFSWSALFDRLEELIPPEVKIQRIAPAISTRRIEVTLAGMSRSPEAFMEFEGNLASSPYFSNVYPVREDQQEGQNELKFSLVMDYIPAGKDVATEPAAAIATTTQAGTGAPPAARTEAATATPPSADPNAPQAAAAEAGAVHGMVPAGTGAAASQAPATVPPPATVVQPSAAAPPPIAPTTVGQPASGQPVPGGSEATGAAQPTEDPNLMSRQEFIQKFGLEEWMYTRGKYRGKARPKKTPEPGQAAQPQGVAP